ncbi:MAG TPA: hypothetical protein VLD67_04640 [Vicinamibacterales bacterium]|nr:hypothetical protein [Vicinamibacterales bacterium]
MAETIETLAGKIDALSISIDKRFDGVDKRLDGVDKRLVGVEKRLDASDARFDGLEKRLDASDNRFDGFEKKLADVRNELLIRIDGVDSKVGLVLEKVEDLIKRDVGNSVTHARFQERLDDHELRLIALEGGREQPGPSG